MAGWGGDAPRDSLRQGMLRSSNGCTKVGEVTGVLQGTGDSRCHFLSTAGAL